MSVTVTRERRYLPTLGLGPEAINRLMDVENECAHGHLPVDANLTCECWTTGRIESLLAQEPLNGDDPLDRAALGDLPLHKPQRESQDKRVLEMEDELLEMHRFYMQPGKTLGETALRFRLSSSTAVRRRFEAHELELKPEGWWRRGANRRFFNHDQEVIPMQPTDTGRPRAEAMYAYYQEDASRSLTDVGERFGLSGAYVGAEFKRFGLKARPQGGSRNGKPERTPAPERQHEPKPETTVSSYAGVIIELERERERLTERLGRIDTAVDAIKELAA